MAEPEMSLEEVERRLTADGIGIVDRMKALFFSRYHDSDKTVDVLKKGLVNDSVLLKHEIAYIMGQLKREYANEVLIELLKDPNEHPMVRHEAAEALAAIGSESSVSIMKAYVEDSCIPLKETCELGIESIEAKKAKKNLSEEKTKVSHYLFTTGTEQPFFTEDPVPRTRKLASEEELGKVLLDQSARLYERYDALFALRNLGTLKAADIVSKALAEDKSSALFRHEVAFVIGQLQSPSSLEALLQCVEDEEENDMARHEAAMALGSVALNESCREEALKCLEKYSTSKSQILAESCLVALDNVQEETS